MDRMALNKILCIFGVFTILLDTNREKKKNLKVFK